ILRRSARWAPTRRNAVRLSDPIASPADRSHVPSPRHAASYALAGTSTVPSRPQIGQRMDRPGPTGRIQIGTSKISDHPRTYKANRKRNGIEPWFGRLEAGVLEADGI